MALRLASGVLCVGEAASISSSKMSLTLRSLITAFRKIYKIGGRHKPITLNIACFKIWVCLFRSRTFITSIMTNKIDKYQLKYVQQNGTQNQFGSTVHGDQLQVLAPSPRLQRVATVEPKIAGNITNAQWNEVGQMSMRQLRNN
jgi:hypothetical protein